jgi:hypothetical protein
MDLLFHALWPVVAVVVPVVSSFIIFTFWSFNLGMKICSGKADVMDYPMFRSIKRGLVLCALLVFEQEAENVLFLFGNQHLCFSCFVSIFSTMSKF